jgi:hypothetical protein
MRRIATPPGLFILLGLASTVGCGRHHVVPPTAPPPGTPAPSASISFVNDADSAGIRFKHVNGAAGKKLFPETMSGGGGFIDYDNDGRLDIVLVNGAPMPGYKGDPRPTMALYHNDGEGKFTDVTKRAGLATTFYGMGIAVGDYDNDGFDDFYVTAVLGPAHLYHNNRNGTFTDVTSSAGVGDYGYWGSSCAWIDYDRDGKLDLFVCNYVKYRSLADQIPCSYRPGTISYCTPRVYQGESCVLYRNLGGGKFQDVSVRAGVHNPQAKALGVAVWDVDGDGWPDVFVANDGVPNYLYHNNHDGTFREIGTEAGIAYSEGGDARAGMGIDAADELFNGRTSMLVTNFSAEMVGLYRQSSKSLFQDDSFDCGIGPATTRSLGFGTFFFDADNDGNNDVLVVNGHVQDDVSLFQTRMEYEQKPLLFQGDGRGKYREVGAAIGGPFAQKVVARGAAWGDVDGDGLLDVLVVVNNGRAQLWHNTSRPENHWIALRLRGTKSNRDGIGAVVTITAAGRKLSTMIRSGSSYLSASDLVAHFGLGSAATVDSVDIKWPSGVVQALGPQQIDRRHEITEPTR